jgi:hypothetical protein
MEISEVREKLQEMMGKMDCPIEELAHELRWYAEKNENPFGKIKSVSQYGGEGKGETWYHIYLLEDHNTYIKFDGHYQSYSGMEMYDGLDGVTVVKPKQKTITVYE